MYAEPLPVPNTVGSSADLSEFMVGGGEEVSAQRLARSHTTQLNKHFVGGNVCLFAIHTKGKSISLGILRLTS